ncbi:MAG: 50S ribosomal protein L18 [Chloroflexota bacterium]
MSAKSYKLRKRRQFRLRRKIYGTAERPRLNVFRSLNHIYAQVIDDDQGVTLASASTVDKGLMGDLAEKPKNEQAKMVGQAVAERAKQAGVSKVVFDRGGFRYHGRIKALADGAREGGLEL